MTRNQRSAAALSAWANAAPTRRTIFWLVMIYVVARLTIAIAAAANRGPWLDELWSLYMEQPGNGLAESARLRWFQDARDAAGVAATCELFGAMEEAAGRPDGARVWYERAAAKRGG